LGIYLGFLQFSIRDLILDSLLSSVIHKCPSSDPRNVTFLETDGKTDVTKAAGPHVELRV